MLYNITMAQKFHEWITSKYVAWRGDAVGNERSITDYAREIGVSQSLMSQWMRPPERGGKVPRSQQSINGLVKLYGNEVYTVLGLHPPEQISIAQLPRSMRRRVAEATEEWMNAVNKMNLDPESDGAITLAVEIFSRHGLSVTLTDTE